MSLSIAALCACLHPAWGLSGEPPPQDGANATRKLLVGYFPQWGLYNNPPYLVKNLVSSGSVGMLDQLNYAQGFVTGGHCSVADANADLNFNFSAQQSITGKADLPSQTLHGNLHQLAELKRSFPRLKILISLEGRGSDFAADVRPENRAAFVSSCIDVFLRGNLAPGVSMPGLFDGIDVDWEYPQHEDASNFLSLLSDLRWQMDALRPGLLLSIAVGPSPRMYDGTDMAEVGKVVDQVGLMTYDFTGPWSHTTGFVAPLAAAATHRQGTVQSSVAAFEAAGVPASKLLIGLPFYGYGWRRVEDLDNGLFQEGEPIRGDHPYTYIQGVAQQSTVFRDPVSQAPWLFDGDVFWTYDDPVSIRSKGCYAQASGTGGFMVWELSGDTPAALLLHTARQSLQPSAAAACASASVPASADAPVRPGPTPDSAPNLSNSR